MVEEAARTKELKQIHEMDALIPLEAEELSEEEKKAVVSSMLLTEKRDGLIKTRQCADGRKLKKCMSKEESPTVSNGAIFITCAIEAKERCNIALVYLPGAFLHAVNDKDIIMNMRGKLAELMTMVALQTYRKYIAIEKGQKVLYVKVHEVLYGMLKSVVLF